MKSIRKLREKFKLFFTNSDFLLVLVIILVALASFGLGRLSSEPKSNKGIIQVEDKDLSSVSASVYAQDQPGFEDVSKVSVVASRSGTKYHFPWCSGAQRIKEENKITFLSIQEAREAGYEPAANCKGLE